MSWLKGAAVLAAAWFIYEYGSLAIAIAIDAVLSRRRRKGGAK